MADLYVGLMSGTSFDGIDTVLVDFGQSTPQVIATLGVPYPKPLQQRLRALITEPQLSLLAFGQLDKQLAHLYSEAINTLLQQNDIKPADVIAVGNHGQTIFHSPPKAEAAELAFSLQIGDPSTIAKNTGIDVVANFRQADIAVGGQGAPLAPAFHAAVFGNKKPLAILNLGGIANLTLLENDTITAFDTGPASTLMDAWINKHKGCDYDHNGEWAASGKVNNTLLTKLLSHPYFAESAPKSTGFETFNLRWLETHIQQWAFNSPKEDIQATLLELTALSISNELQPYTGNTLLVCGGGVHNLHLMQRLKTLTKLKVESTESYGVHPDWLEAIAFAWLAKQTIERKTGNAPSVTGATQEAILGGIFPH